jgi:hypothetical protein
MAAIIFALIGWLLLVPGSALAQYGAVPTVKQMKVSLLPEYDDPRVLGIYRGIFDSSGKVPQRVSFLIPKEAEVSQACSLTEDEEHLCQFAEKEAKGEFIQVSFNLPQPRFLLEFYFPLAVQGVEKAASLVFSSAYPIQSLQAEVMKPLRAEGFEAAPQPASFTRDSVGLEYGSTDLGNLAAGKQVEIKLGYRKSDSRPSVAKQASGAPGQGQVVVPTKEGGRTYLAIMVAILGGGALLLVGYMIAARKRPAPAPVGKPQTKPARKVRAKFCPGCGNQLTPGSNFCPECGNKLT